MLPSLTPEESSGSPDVMGGEVGNEAANLRQKIQEISRLPNYFESSELFPSLKKLKDYKRWMEGNPWNSISFAEHINLVIGMGNYLLENSDSFESDYIYEIQKVISTLVKKLPEFPENWPEAFKDLLDENPNSNAISKAIALVMKLKSVFSSGKLDISSPIEYIISDMRNLGKSLRDFHELVELFEGDDEF